MEAAVLPRPMAQDSAKSRVRPDGEMWRSAATAIHISEKQPATRSATSFDRAAECAGSFSCAGCEFAGDRDASAASDMRFERVALASRSLGNGVALQ